MKKKKHRVLSSGLSKYKEKKQRKQFFTLTGLA